MNEANRLKLGAFLLISITLLVVSFVSVGITKLFAPKYRAMTILSTSVEGLAVGSPVKYLGMPVGKITAMAMREKDGTIAVYFDIFPSAVEGEGSDPGEGDLVTLSNIMQQKNLTCFLNAAGLMGGSYLELSLNDALPAALPHPDFTPPTGIVYIPSRPSHIGNAIQNVSRMLDELEKVNFIQLADKLDETLDNVSGFLNQSELRETLKSVNSISVNLEGSVRNLQNVLSEANVRKLNQTIDNVDRSIRNISEVAGSDDLKQLVRNLDAFLVEARTLMTDLRRSGREVGADAEALRIRFEMTLTRLDNTLRQLSNLAENLSADPNQFVRGRQEPPVQPAGR